MHDTPIERLSAALSRMTFDGADGRRLVDAACRLLQDAGLPLDRVVIGMDTLHPVMSGSVYEWRPTTEEVRRADYGRAVTKDDDIRWQRSPFFTLWEGRDDWLRVDLRTVDRANPPYSIIPELLADGLTDYIAAICRFDPLHMVGRVDGVYSSWATRDPGGFSDRQIDLVGRALPVIALAMRATVLQLVAETVATTYLGQDAARRVLDGTIERGAAQEIDAVLWLSDLSGFTRIVDAVEPDQVMPMLNAYAEVAVAAIEASGGQVLKFLGDGVLAVYQGGKAAAQTSAALDAARNALSAARRLSEERRAQGLPATDLYVALHQGRVHYGNFGGPERLDFTVIGRAVNEVSRLLVLCKQLEQSLALSASFADRLDDRARLVSLGRYMLRGIGRPQELYTLADPA